ncbi:ATP-grasp domain-containing protein [Brachybacterium aquaticum]|uniref:ATP-grasp domain-containing protein n=1 Tax=Brachybacterium aquaticum TaxID=1432564 RepID=A0A841AHN0_9MICO|nr:hypothetical protein [Brachybacterium aquaticum]MBB5832835.1 hypothetical protein [Brachybacterium aquaticum]
MPRIAIVITGSEDFPHAHTTLDSGPLVSALRARGAEADAVVWHDAGVDWSAYDVAVLRSPWDYLERGEEWEAWLDRASAVTTVLNDPALVRWNMDKRYLDQLEQAGIPGVPTRWLEDEASLRAALAEAADGAGAADGGAAEPHVVLKPAVSAGAKHTGLFSPADPAAAELGRQILAEGGVVMLQPEVAELSEGREKALYVVDGHFTHSISKGALLARGGGLRGGTYQESPQVMQTSAEERAFAERVLTAVAEVTGQDMPLYARIDTVDTAAHGLVLLEAELFEPLFNLHVVSEAAEPFADAILRRV